MNPSPIKTPLPLGQRAAGLKQSWRVFWFGVTFVVFTVLTYLAFFHARLGSVSRPSFFSIGWWLQPIEFNAPSRISHVESGVDFTCISALAGGRELWVGGSKGVIIYSTDGGKTWEQLPTVTASAESSATKTQPTPTPQSKSKAFYLKPSDLRSLRMADANSEQEEWIHVSENTPVRPDRRQQQIVPNAANQAAPRSSVGKNLPIDKAQPNAADQTAPTLSPSETEQGVTGIPAIGSEVPKQTAPTSNLPPPSRFLSSNDISELQCIRAGLIYALTSAGELIVTRDGGKNWRLLSPNFPDPAAFAVNVKFSDDNSGICVGNTGSLEKVRLSDFYVTTTDGGESWSEPMPAPFAIADVALMGGLEGQAVGKAAQVLDVAGGKLGRRENISGLKDPFGGFLRITRTTAGSFFSCGFNGTIARSVNGRRWQAVDTRVPADLHGISFASNRAGWAVGKEGVVIATRDGGDHWEKQSTGTDSWLRDVYFSSPRHGFAAGDNGTLIGTEDGGRHWYPVVLAGSGGAGGYGWLPAPWYFVALLLLFGLVRKIPEEIVPSTRQGIAELLASDKPIGPEDPDYLGFRQVALGLSNYLRNNATKPPLTVAVTGEWGMGKSSLMNLVQGDLRSYKFRPVWFNAWHHQKRPKNLCSRRSWRTFAPRRSRPSSLRKELSSA